jgi:putative glutamine amidotransferase
MSRRPLIGITCGATGQDDPVKYGQNRSYVRAVEAAGGVPLLIPPQASIDELIELLDGIVFSGGGDLDPTFYDLENRGSGEIDRDRDELELGLARAAAAHGMPVLGICRGQQVINVALDGGLIQDVDEHRQQASRDAVTHFVEVTRGSHLAGSLGERVEVNTFHHQVVDPARVGRGLKVTAFSDDSKRVIEGLESEDGSIQAVQWHPEDLTDRAWARALFERLVNAARAPAPGVKGDC